MMTSFKTFTFMFLPIEKHPRVISTYQTNCNLKDPHQNRCWTSQRYRTMFMYPSNTPCSVTPKSLNKTWPNNSPVLLSGVFWVMRIAWAARALKRVASCLAQSWDVKLLPRQRHSRKMVVMWVWFDSFNLTSCVFTGSLGYVFWTWCFCAWLGSEGKLFVPAEAFDIINIYIYITYFKEANFQIQSPANSSRYPPSNKKLHAYNIK